MKTTINIHAEEIEAIWNDLGESSRLSITEAGLAAKELVEFPERRRWLKIGAGFAVVRAEAKRLAGTDNLKHPTYRRYFALIIAKVPDLVALDEHDHASCQHAVWLYTNWEEVESFLAPLGIAVNNKLNHPTAIKRRFDAAHKVKPQGLEKRPTPLALKTARIQELEQQVRELEVRDLGSVIYDNGDDLEAKVVNQVVTTKIFNRLHNSETQWGRYYAARNNSKEEQDAFDSATEETQALTILLRDRYPESTSRVAEIVVKSEKQEDDENYGQDQKFVVDVQFIMNDDSDFATLKEKSVVLGCLLFLCDTRYSDEGGEFEDDSKEELEKYAARIIDLVQEHLMQTNTYSFRRTIALIASILNQQETEAEAENPALVTSTRE